MQTPVLFYNYHLRVVLVLLMVDEETEAQAVPI